MWYRAIVLMLALLLGSRAQAQESVSLASLIGHLDHPDPAVRQQAERALVARGFSAMAAVEKAGAETVRRALLLANRLSKAPKETADFWLAYEDVHLLAPDHLRGAVLRLALQSPVTVYDLERERERAMETVRVFCLTWNEVYRPGSEEKKRYDGIRKRLEECGFAAAPHLLRVLDRNDRKVFGNLNHQRGVTARMQVRAIFGVSFLSIREAVPYLLIHSSNMSYTAGVNAAAAFNKLTRGDQGVPFQKPDMEKIVAWWKKHRTEFPVGTRWITGSVIEDLHESVAAEILGKSVLAPEDPALAVRRLELLTGRGFEFDAEAPAEKRLSQVRAIEAWFDGERWR